MHGPSGGACAAGSGPHAARSTDLCGGRLLLLRLGGLGSLLGPGLVELHAPLAVFGLLERQPSSKALARAALEAAHRLLGPAGPDQLARDRERQLLARLRLPDHETAAGILARPARVALAVLDDVVAADRARPELGARDPHVLELGVELADRRAGELGDVAHERAAVLVAALDGGQPLLPVAGQRRRGQRVLAEQP